VGVTVTINVYATPEVENLSLERREVGVFSGDRQFI